MSTWADKLKQPKADTVAQAPPQAPPQALGAHVSPAPVGAAVAPAQQSPPVLPPNTTQPPAQISGAPRQAGVPGQGGPMPDNTHVALHFGNLRKEVTLQMLYDILKEANAAITNIRIVRHRVTREPLGYAYVNFKDKADADKVREKLNYMPIHGQPVRISRVIHDRSVRDSGKGNIFIRGLARNVTDQSLYHTFVKFGPILSCKVSDDSSGDTTHAYVHYENIEDAQKAINAVDGKFIAEHQIKVEHFVPRDQRDRKDPEETFKNCYVKNFSPSVTEAQFNEYFGRFGAIASAKLMMTDGETPVSRGFGFVSFEEHEQAVAAIKSTSDVVIPELSDGEKALFCARHQVKKERLRKKEERDKQIKLERSKNVNVHVKPLDPEVDEQKLQDVFQEYGELVNTCVMRDEAGVSRGFGFVCFKTKEGFQKASDRVDGRDGILGKKVLRMSQHQPKAQREQHQMAMRNLASVNAFPRMPGFGAHAQYHPMAFGMPHHPGMGRGYNPQFVGGFPGQGMQGMPPYNQHMMAGYRQQPNMPPHQAAAVPPGGAPMQQGAVPTQELANMTKEERRNHFGSALITLVSALPAIGGNSDVAARIVGMLLELDETEHIELTENPSLLEDRVNEGLRGIQAQQQQQRQ